MNPATVEEPFEPTRFVGTREYGQSVTASRVPTRTVVYAKIVLTIVQGPDAGRSLETAGRRVRIGTAADNDLVLADTTVSRYHCEVLPRATAIDVDDCGSTNGTFNGPVLIRRATFFERFSLRLGETLIEVSPLDDTIEREQIVADRFGDMLGGSACMRELFADLARVAPTDISVLIEGETGTGKELVADAIHRASSRAGCPFIVFDCSAVASNLVESELFGHERGAFTGAVGSRAGVFEQANGGTIFLDELGELPMSLQPKLLRVIESREVRRVGSNKTIPVDVRLVSATNRDLMAEVKRGAFREDLFFRVAATRVGVPPLRDRLDDLPLLVGHFLSMMRPPVLLEDLPAPIWELFSSHRWPGNVRELRNVVQRAVLTPGRSLSTALLAHSAAFASAPEPEPAEESVAIEPLRIARREATDTFEQQYLRRLLVRTGGSVQRGAALAEVSRQMIQKLLKKHDM